MTASPTSPAEPTAAAAPRDDERRVIVLPVDAGLVCLRGLSPKRLRFEVEYGLERGTTANSFLFEAGPDAQGRPMPPVLVHPPGASFAAPFLAELAARLPTEAPLKVVVGHVNPNRVALLRELARRWPALMLVASNAGARLLLDPSQPVEPLIAEFVTLYYGAAAPAMRRLLDYLERRQGEEPGMLATVPPRNRAYFDRTFFIETDALLAEAEARAGSDPDVTARVRQERLPLDETMLFLWDALARSFAGRRSF